MNELELLIDYVQGQLDAVYREGGAGGREMDLQSGKRRAYIDCLTEITASRDRAASATAPAPGFVGIAVGMDPWCRWCQNAHPVDVCCPPPPPIMPPQLNAQLWEKGREEMNRLLQRDRERG